MIPAINAIIEPGNAQSPLDSPHRILWLSKKTNEIVLFRIQKPYGIPFFCQLSDIQHWLKSGVMRTGEFLLPAWLQKTEDEISERDKNYRGNRWELISPLVTNENRTAIFDRTLRGPIIRQRAIETNKKREWFYPLLKRYWLYGQTQNALLPAFQACSKNAQLSVKAHNKRGRPPIAYVAGHDLSALGVNVTKEDLRIFLNCLRELHLRKGFPITDTYTNMIEQYYSEKVIRNGEIFNIPITENKKIKLGAFRYWSNKLLADLSLQKEVMDETLWKKKFRGKPGRAPDTTIGASDIFEIDATPDNCYLVSQFHRNHLIGKGVLYYVIDRSSTMITGFHAALEGPSWNTARFALYNTFTDKVEYCKQYGINISPEDWPCQEVCSLLVADQGEILSKNAMNSLQNMLHIDTDYNAVGQADNKGTVESTHIQISEPISWAPGAWRAREKERNKYKDKKLLFDACLTLAERIRIIIYEILERNNNVRVEHLLTKEMIQDGVKPYRRDIYLWGLEYLIGEPRQISDKKLLYRCLLPKESASITERGLLYKNMYYLPEGIDYDLLLAQARKKRIPVKIHVDYNSSNFVYQLDETNGSWINWRLSEFSWERYANLRLEEILELNATQKFDAHDSKDAESKCAAIKNQSQQRVTNMAKKEKRKAELPPSKNQYYKNVKQNRMMERDIERMDLAQKATNSDKPAQDASPTTTASIVNISSAMQKRRTKVISSREEK